MLRPIDLRWGEHDRNRNGSVTCIPGHINLNQVVMNTKARWQRFQLGLGVWPGADKMADLFRKGRNLADASQGLQNRGGSMAGMVA